MYNKMRAHEASNTSHISNEAIASSSHCYYLCYSWMDQRVGFLTFWVRMEVCGMWFSQTTYSKILITYHEITLSTGDISPKNSPDRTIEEKRLMETAGLLGWKQLQRCMLSGTCHLCTANYTSVLPGREPAII